MEITREFMHTLRERLTEDLNFIQVVIGPRQIGKTTGLRQIVDKWEGPYIMVSADEIAPPTGDWIELHWKRARAIGAGTLLVIDEVQKIPNWSTVVKRLFDEDRVSAALKVVLLESASLTLQRGLAESLAGRFEVIHADHWSLAECNKAFGWGILEFLKFGGYPAAASLVHDEDRWQKHIRNAIIEPVLIRDLLGMSAVNKPALFRQTFETALCYPAQEVSLQKLLGQLQESGNVSTIKHYLEMYEGAFLLRSLQKFSGSAIRKRASSPKILPLNNALIHAFRKPSEVDSNQEWRGRVFECAVGAALAHLDGHLYYWRDGRHEVDFVMEKGKRVFAVEVKSGRMRGRRGLERFMQLYPSAIPVVIDWDKGEELLYQTLDEFPLSP
jgi:predicted AAA+ superfamily ATPase